MQVKTVIKDKYITRQKEKPEFGSKNIYPLIRVVIRLLKRIQHIENILSLKFTVKLVYCLILSRCLLVLGEQKV